MLGSFIDDNIIAIIGLLITAGGGLVAWLTALKADLTTLTADIRHMRELMESAGNDSRRRGDGIAGHIEQLDERVRAIEVKLGAMLPRAAS